MASKYEDKTNEELDELYEEIKEELTSRRRKKIAEEEEKAIKAMKKEYEASKAKAIKAFRHKIIADYGVSEEAVGKTTDEVIVFIKDLCSTINDCKDELERKDLAIKNHRESYEDLNKDYCKLLAYRHRVLNRLPEKILKKYDLN